MTEPAPKTVENQKLVIGLEEANNLADLIYTMKNSVNAKYALNETRKCLAQIINADYEHMDLDDFDEDIQCAYDGCSKELRKMAVQVVEFYCQGKKRKRTEK